jgi:hypothetical protein
VGVGDVLSVFDERETPKELQSSFGVFLLPTATRRGVTLPFPGTVKIKVALDFGQFVEALPAWCAIIIVNPYSPGSDQTCAFS